MPTIDSVEQAKQRFGELLEAQQARVDKIKSEGEPTDFTALDHIEIGVLGGDGIGPSIAHESQRVLEALLEDQVSSGRVSFRTIDGLTIERRAEELAAIPEGVLKEIHECDVTLKGPTTTPEQGDGWPNIESANVAMRKVLDLYANVRPVRVPAEGIDWTFFRENTEDLYAVGSEGFSIGDLNIDFKILSNPGSERIIRAAFDYAKNNGKNSVTIVTKANVVKTTDGAFLDAARKVAEDFEGIEWEGWYIDIMTAKLVDPKRRTNFQVFRAAQPLRRHPDRRSGRVPGRRRHCRRGQHWDQDGDVRGDSRLGSTHGPRGTRHLRRPVVNAAGRRHAALAHRLPRLGRQARQGDGPLRPVREGTRDDRPRHRRHDRRVRRLRAVDGQRLQPGRPLDGGDRGRPRRRLGRPMADQLRVERARAERAEASRKTAVARADALEERARQAEKQARDLRAHLDRLAAKLSTSGEEIEPLRNELRETRAELDALRSRAEESALSAESANAQVAGLTQRAELAEHERDRLRLAHTELTEKSTFYEQAAKEASSSLAAASAAQVEAEKQAADAQAALDARHEEFRQERNRLSRENDRLQKEVERLQAELDAAQSGLGGALRRRFGG